MVVSNKVSPITQPGQSGKQTAAHGNPSTNPTLDCYKPKGIRYFGALVLLASIIPLPFFVGLITIIVYLSSSFFQGPGASTMVIIFGLIITLVLWLLLAIPCGYFATAEGGRPSDYQSLTSNAGVLKKQLEVVKSGQATQNAAKSATPIVQYKKAAIEEIECNLEIFKNTLNRDGLPWVSYTGYVSMWDRINKVDEAMVGVLPCQTVIESANYDDLSLSGDPESKDLLDLLHDAIASLNSVSKGHKQSSEQNQGCDLQQSLALPMLDLLKEVTDPSSLSAANNGQDSQQSEQEARANIRKVKAALHKFTNERWDGLVRARNQLMGTAFLTAFFTYILVIIAILANVPRMNTINAMVFYFLGAIVGLFGRLFDERNADKVIDDYGLSMIRIIVTPLISGLAVLIGILILTTSSTIATIYTITMQNLIYAAVLGFAPNILINNLQSKSEEIKSQIKSTSPTDQKSGKDSSGSSKGNNSSSG
ncbi:MAG TPA: hypothetical protein VN954_09105 [Ktedonobacteraceae bacterium]|nr:hypothetical protein [Ktedonobacteraceae bacterium]